MYFSVIRMSAVHSLTALALCELITYITDYVDNVGRLIVSVLLLVPVRNSRE